MYFMFLVKLSRKKKNRNRLFILLDRFFQKVKPQCVKKKILSWSQNLNCSVISKF